MHRLLLAGFGGQGIMVMGELLAYAAMAAGKQVTYMPSYGPEMRGGTANCSVVVSEEPISSPIVSAPQVLVAMNEPSLVKFEGGVRPEGIVFVNRSLIQKEPGRGDIEYVFVDCAELARGIASERLSNIVMLGAVFKKTGLVPLDALYEAMDKKFTGDKAKYIPANRKALGAFAAGEGLG